MKPSNAIVSRPASKYQTAESIINGACPDCGGPLSVDMAHVGGYAEYQPVVVYDYHSETCPRKGEHYIQRISFRLAMEVDELIHWTETSFGLQQEEEASDVL